MNKVIRKTHQEKIEQLNALLPERYLYQGDDGNKCKNLSGYMLKRQAMDKILIATNNTILLVSGYYRGHEQPHFFQHRCGGVFIASFAEILEIGHAQICPYCHKVHHPRHFGNMESLQRYVLSASMENAYLYAYNRLGEKTDVYDFYCNWHNKPYRATFEDFLKTQGETNGCPLCMEEKKGAIRRNAS